MFYILCLAWNAPGIRRLRRHVQWHSYSLLSFTCFCSCSAVLSQCTVYRGVQSLQIFPACCNGFLQPIGTYAGINEITGLGKCGCFMHVPLPESSLDRRLVQRRIFSSCWWSTQVAFRDLVRIFGVLAPSCHLRCLRLWWRSALLHGIYNAADRMCLATTADVVDACMHLSI